MKYLIFAGANLDAWYDGRTPLMNMAEKCQTTSSPADAVNAGDSYYNKTALYRVVEQGKSSKVQKALKVLLQLGADPDIRPTYPQDSPMPIELALTNKDYKAMEYLLEQGAKVNYMNYTNTTMLYRATSENNVRALELLVKYAAAADVASPGARQTNYPYMRQPRART